MNCVPFYFCPLVECLFVDNDVHCQNHHAWAFSLPGLAEVLAEDPPAVLDAMRAFEPRATIMTIAFLAACLDDPSPRLSAHAEKETSKSVLQAIEEARALLAPTASAPSEDAREDGAQGDRAADGSYVAAPPFVEPPPSRLLPGARRVGGAGRRHQCRRLGRTRSATRAALAGARYAACRGGRLGLGMLGQTSYGHRERSARAHRRARRAYQPPLAATAVDPLLDVLTGAAPPASARSFYSSYWGLVGDPNLTKSYRLAQKRMKAFLARPDIDWRHLARLKLVNDDTRSDVPPILLAGAWADDCAMAAAGSGFDPDWETKTR